MEETTKLIPESKITLIGEIHNNPRHSDPSTFITANRGGYAQIRTYANLQNPKTTIFLIEDLVSSLKYGYDDELIGLSKFLTKKGFQIKSMSVATEESQSPKENRFNHKNKEFISHIQNELKTAKHVIAIVGNRHVPYLFDNLNKNYDVTPTFIIPHDPEGKAANNLVLKEDYKNLNLPIRTLDNVIKEKQNEIGVPKNCCQALYAKIFGEKKIKER